jgi:hypothetical protein
MREIRTSGSEGGGTETNRFSLPLSPTGRVLKNAVLFVIRTSSFVIRTSGRNAEPAAQRTCAERHLEC